jgi:hypothetical protein
VQPHACAAGPADSELQLPKLKAGHAAALALLRLWPACLDAATDVAALYALLLPRQALLLHERLLHAGACMCCLHVVTLSILVISLVVVCV